MVNLEGLPARIAITGAGGYLGRAVIKALDRAGFDSTVVAIDVVEPASLPDFVEFHFVDATTDAATELLARCDAVVHLAYVFRPTRDPEAEARANVEMFERVAAAALRPGGPRRIVVLSSATVYGAYDNNPVPLVEESVLRPNEGFVYAVCKGEIERRVLELRDDLARAGGAEVRIAVLRPAIVLGPHASNYLVPILIGPQPVAVAGPRPPVQFVHERDVANAILHVLARGADGAFNVAADGWMTAEEVDDLLGRRPPLFRVPEDASRRALGRLFDVGLVALPPAVLPYIQHPWVVANTRLANEGFEPEYTSAGALRAVRDAATTARRTARRQRRKRLRPVAALGAAAAAAYLLGLLARRRRI